MQARPVVFRNRDGLQLFGVVHEPAPAMRRPVAVVLLSPGTKYRVAPHRLYVKLARRLVGMGFFVLRFDFAGLGDSEGEIDEAMVADFFGTVQLGRYVGDTCAAMDWMAREFGCSSFILAGLCGGAITGLLAGARDRRVDGLIGLGLPVQLDSANVEPSKNLTAGELRQWREGYLAKLADPASWLRLLTFRSNYRVMIRALIGDARPRVQDNAPASAPSADNANPLVPEAFDAMARQGYILLVFGEADRLHSIYEDQLVQGCAVDFARYGDHVAVHVVPAANHVFSLPDWEAAMSHHVETWLGRLDLPKAAVAAGSAA